jgi:hypothetical protein
MKDIRVGDFVNVLATGKVVGEHEDLTMGGTYFIVQFGDDRLFRGNFSKDQLCEVEEGVEDDQS